MNSDKLMQCIGNPVMCKLLLEIKNRGQATTKQLAETYSDVPQATLYRYLNRMLKDGILKVVSENKVRGMLEKVYALQVELPVDTGERLEERAGEEYLQAFAQFMMGFMREFQEYARQKSVDIQKDGTGFSSCPLYLSDEELAEMMAAIKNVIQPFQENMASENRKLRSLGIILTPPQKRETDNGFKAI